MPLKSILSALRARFWDSGASYPWGPPGPSRPLYPDISEEMEVARREREERDRAIAAHASPGGSVDVEEPSREHFGKRKVPPPEPVGVPAGHVMRLCSPEDISLIETAEKKSVRAGNALKLYRSCHVQVTVDIATVRRKT